MSFIFSPNVRSKNRANRMESPEIFLINLEKSPQTGDLIGKIALLVLFVSRLSNEK